jgi:hypothetical protein
MGLKRAAGTHPATPPKRAPGRAGRRDEAVRPEHWAVETDRDDVARLDIPPHASRERSFEIWCSFRVAHPGTGNASHALRVLVDGAQEWSRRVPTDPGGRDALDVRLRRVVPAGQPLRLTAIGAVDRAVPLGLSISAEED